jgi:hypothetical protein
MKLFKEIQNLQKIEIIKPRKSLSKTNKSPANFGSDMAEEDNLEDLEYSPEFFRPNFEAQSLSGEGFLYFSTSRINTEYISTLRRFLLKSTQVESKKKF